MKNQITKKEQSDSDSEDKKEKTMKDVATQMETNTKTMMILFDERKEMILELMAMVEKIHKIAVAQLEQNFKLKAEISTLSAKSPRKTIRSKLRPCRCSSRQLYTRVRSNHTIKKDVNRDNMGVLEG